MLLKCYLCRTEIKIGDLIVLWKDGEETKVLCDRSLDKAELPRNCSKAIYREDCINCKFSVNSSKFSDKGIFIGEEFVCTKLLDKVKSSLLSTDEKAIENCNYYKSREVNQRRLHIARGDSLNDN